MRNILPLILIIVTALATAAGAADVAGTVSATGDIIISGRLIGADGTATRGARVTLEPFADDYSTARDRLEGETAPTAATRATTRADGRFRLAAPAAGLWRIVVKAAGHPAMEVRLEPLLDDVELPDLKLEPADELDLYLVGPGGTPRAGRILVTSRPPAPARKAYGWRTAARGVHVSDGVVRLFRGRAEALRIEAAAAGLAPATIDVAADRPTARLGLNAGSEYRIRITDPRGHPLAGALAFDGDGRLPLSHPADDDGQLTLWLEPDAGPIRLLSSDGHIGAFSPRAAAPQAIKRDRVIEVRLEPPLEISGRVLELFGREPIPAALVWTANAWRAEADGQGRFTLSLPALPSTPLIQAAAAGHALAHKAAGTGLTLLLPPAATVRGRIVDADGRPRDGVDVEATMAELGTVIATTLADVDPRSLAPRPWRGRTGEDGRFSLPGLIAGAGYELSFARRGLATGGLRVDALEAFETRDVEMVLSAGRSGHGWVAERDGTPVASARIRLVKPKDAAHVLTRHRRVRSDAADVSQATSDTLGRFTLRDIGTGRFQLEVRAAGFAPATVPGLDLQAGGQQIDFGTVVMVPGATIHGTVEDADGGSVASAEIRARRRAAMSLAPAELRVASDDGGRFLIADLRPGERRHLTVTAPGFGVTTAVAVAAVDGEPLTVMLRREARLSGRVVDDLGAAIADARVVFEPALGDPREPARTDGRGRFLIAGVTPGVVAVEARADGFQTSRLTGLRATAGEELGDIELALKPGALVSGLVSRPDGEPAAGARVTVVSSRQGSPLPAAVLDAIADGDGRYHVDGVPPGPASVAARDSVSRRVEKRVEIAPGSQTVDLTFTAGHEVSGRVEGARGLAIPGAAVTLESLDGFVPEVVSARDGSFAFTDVPTGRYQVTATREGYAPAAGPVAIEAVDAGGIVLRLEYGSMVLGRVIGAGFDELASLVVHAFSTDGDARRGRVDYDGRYRVPNLGPGRWIVQAEVAGTGRSTSGEVVLESGEAEMELDLELHDGLTLTGIVLDHGTALAGVQVVAAGEHKRGSTLTDSSGRFRLDHLPAGGYRLGVTTRNGRRHEQTLELLADDEVLIELASSRVAATLPSTEDN